MTQKLRWGLLAAGHIAGAFAKGVAHSKTGVVQAVASRDRRKAEAFAETHGVATVHEGYDALLADPDVDVVYISTPHPGHAEWAVKAAEAGKHILCEKPLTLNAATAMAVIEAAASHDVFLMEAFMYRCHPQTRRLVDLLREQVIGEVLGIEASFSFAAGFNPEGRLFAPALGGGGILDIGCYTISMARLIAGVARGGEVAEPLEFKALGHLGPTGVDDNTVAIMRFPGDILAQVATGITVRRENAVRIQGADGMIVVPWPWGPGREGGASVIEVTGKDGVKQDIGIETREWLWGIEADAVAAAIRAGRRQAVFPAPTWDDTLNNMRVLDQWRAQLGLVYPRETPGTIPTIDGRPLRRGGDAPIPKGTIDGLDKPVSRLVMGVDNQRTLDHAVVMFDDYFRKGGNCFDTARIYGNAEILLGQWIRERNLRDQVVILDKGAHTPFCTPADMDRQLSESLERLQTEAVDIYMFHRDNLEVPVGEFVDAITRRIRAGHASIWGASNWTLERIEAANGYAARNGLEPIRAISNNLSLARMIDPVWAGSLSINDPASRDWLRTHKIPLMPWSSQGRGFFTDRAAPDRREEPELVRCWYSDDNFRRRERALVMAAEKGVPPIAIALAWVLCQPFETFPLIGPRQLCETRSSLMALDIRLTPSELAWLDLESADR